MRADIVPGATFPDYELPDHTGKHRTLSEIQRGDPMIVMLSRGNYCPKDRRQLEGLALLHRELEVGYCRLVTISTDNLLETNEMRAASRRTGRSCRIRRARCRRTSTSPSTPTRLTTR